MARRSEVMVSRTLYQMGVISLIVSVLWVAVSIYSATGKNFKVDIDQSVLEPITPNLDIEVIQTMTGRQKIEIDFAAIAAQEEVLVETGDLSSDAVEEELTGDVVFDPEAQVEDEVLGVSSDTIQLNDEAK